MGENDKETTTVENDVLEKINSRLGGIEIHLEVNNEKLKDVKDDICKIQKSVTILEERETKQNGKLKSLESDVKPIKNIKAIWKIPFARKIIIGIIILFVVTVLFAGGENMYNVLKAGLIKILGI